MRSLQRPSEAIGLEAMAVDKDSGGCYRRSGCGLSNRADLNEGNPGTSVFNTRCNRTGRCVHV